MAGLLGTSSNLGMSVHAKRKGLLSLCPGGRHKRGNPVWDVLMKQVDLGEPRSLLDQEYLGCTQRECKPIKNIVQTRKDLLKSLISAGTFKQLLSWERCPTRTPLPGPLIWKFMRRNAWKGTANWQSKKIEQ